MISYTFGMAETLAVAVILLIIGKNIKKSVKVLERFFIPAPVIGGLIFSIITLIGRITNTFAFEFDGNLKTFLMIVFFTTIGFSASFELLKKGGIGVVIFLIVSTGLVVVQDIAGIYLAKLFNLHPYIGLAAGSIPLTGGHGTSAAFGQELDKVVAGASSVAIASATFGLVAGCLIGGPIAKKLVQKYNLKSKDKFNENNNNNTEDNGDLISEKLLFDGIVTIAICMGIGAIISAFAKKLGITLPVYIGPMIIAAITRNIFDKSSYDLPMKEISAIGNISLSLFLSIALMTMKLWELASLAIPLIVILLAQTVIMGLYAYFVTFNVMGRDYDAAVMATGHCGFGLGASPNAMANMETFTATNGYSEKAFFIVPLVGALFIDFTNATIITAFMNFFK